MNFYILFTTVNIYTVANLGSGWAAHFEIMYLFQHFSYCKLLNFEFEFIAFVMPTIHVISD